MKSNFFPFSSDKLMRLSGTIVIGGSLLCIIGWLFNIEILKTFVPGTTSIKFNTAVIFLLIGAVMILMSDKKDCIKRQNWILYLTIAYGAIAAVVGGQYVFHVNLGIDELVFSDNQLHYSFPGRIAHTTAAYILVHSIGVLFILKGNERLRSWAVILMNWVTIMCILALLGYALNLPVFIPYPHLPLWPLAQP